MHITIVIWLQCIKTTWSSKVKDWDWLVLLWPTWCHMIINIPWSVRMTVSTVITRQNFTMHYNAWTIYWVVCVSRTFQQRLQLCKQLEQLCTPKPHKAEVRDKGLSSKKTLYVRAWLKGTERNVVVGGGGGGGGQWIRVMGRKGRAQLPSFIPPVLLPLSLLSQPAGPQPQREDFPFSLLPPCSFLFIRFHAMPAKTTPSSCPEWLWSPLQRGTFSQRAMKEPFRWCWPCFDLSIQWEQESQVQLVSLWETDWPALPPHLYTRVEKWWQRVALVCSRFCPKHLCLECSAQLNSPNCLITSWKKNKPKQRRTLQEKTGNAQLWNSTWIVSYHSIFQVFNLRSVQNCWQIRNTAIILSDLCFDMEYLPVNYNTSEAFKSFRSGYASPSFWIQSDCFCGM